jgi:hypothetical protein
MQDHEIKKTLTAINEYITNSTIATAGIDVFIRALVHELAIAEPALLRNIRHRLEAINPMMLDDAQQVASRSYAVLLVNSERRKEGGHGQ